MKPAHVLVAVIFGGLLPVGGQTLPPQKAPEILRTSTDTNLLRWHGHQGRSYFLQVSDPSKHLEKWLWMPVIIAGADAEISQEVQTTGNKGFYRICYTDQVPGAGETLETADFDQDGLSNINEIRPQNGLATHPLNPDTDADGLKDGWEVSHAFNPHDSSDAAGDKDGDGLTNLQEYQWGANPTNPDTDGDGALDGDEKNGNTNPKDPKSAPQEGWIVLTGDHAKEERKALKRTVTIPKGQTRLVMVVLHSEEYPEYTEYNSEFDDLLEWKITPTGGTEIAGQADVNDKHADWQLAESNGTAIKNFYPAHIEKVSSLTAPPEKDLIVTLELAATNISDDEKPSTAMVGLLPVEVAPEVLAVNSDFDEGRIDAATGYAIPDCDDMAGVNMKTGSGNTQIALNASRAHLDGLFANDEKVTDDMHKGWFGVNPSQLEDSFWAGANVTIRKVDKIDADTGYQESGQIRFYAKWSGGYYGIAPYDFQTLQPVNLVSAGVNGNNSSVYGATSTIPDDAEFYIEGVRPGKITLEWRLQKGSIDVKHEQTFKVETRKTVAQWQEEVRYQIRLQTKVKSGTEVDVALYHPGNGFRNANLAQDNVLRINAIYDYYQQLFKQMPEKFMWAGMAKVAAAPIYAGMSDLNTWWQATEITPPWPPYQGPGDRDYGVEVFIEGLLLSGQKTIFLDMAWAHRSYNASGIFALNYVDSIETAKSTNYSAWRSINIGILDNDQSVIFSANGDLLKREQEEVVQANYNLVQNLRLRQPPAHPNINGGVMVAVDANGLANAGEWLSANSNNNPLPGGPGFRATFPSGRLDYYDDRWAWTSNSASGMLQIWTGSSTTAPGFDAGRRASENGKTIKAAASAYSYDPAGLP
ncbi:MAG: hypothetical protein ACK46A_11440 [Akkermansiaceae bacterium]|nr:thrombospondin type 3 repeat-containing protein [Luteolibacter sp.]